MSQKRGVEAAADGYHGHDEGDIEGKLEAGGAASVKRQRLGVEAEERERKSEGSVEEEKEAMNDVAASAADQQKRHSLAQRCHTDALHGIYAFLTLKELLPAAHSCKDWYAAAKNEKGRQLKWEVTAARRPLLHSLVASPLNHHIADLQCPMLRPSWSVEELRLIRTLPCLVKLFISVDGASEQTAVESAACSGRAFDLQLFPPRLESLRLLLIGHPRLAQQVMLNALQHCEALKKLSININGMVRQLDFSPLLTLPHFKSLSILLSSSLNEAQIGVLKRLRNLETLGLEGEPWTLQQLALFCSPPHELTNLKNLLFGGINSMRLTAAYMQQLVKLPAIEAIDSAFLALGALPYLRNFHNLKCLRIALPDKQGAVNAGAILPHLLPCANLTDLFLERSRFNGDEWRHLFTALPKLEVLSLNDMAHLNLHELAESAQSVRKLRLYNCAGLRSADLLHLAVMPHLREVTIKHCLTLTPFELQVLTSPSKLLPQLTKFNYRAP